MYKALVCCRAGMGSSMLLKIKVDQVISEQGYAITAEHGSLDSIVGFHGDFVVTMDDLANELSGKVPYVLGIKNIMDKEEIKTKIEAFLKTKK
ncbi:MAG: PTS sugar transporter subunit IIB [Breznakia sp.]